MKLKETTFSNKVCYFRSRFGGGKVLLMLFCSSLIFFLNFCTPGYSEKESILEKEIDSINAMFIKDFKFDTLKIIELERLIRLSDSISYFKGITELAITAARLYYFDFQNKKSLDMLNIANEAMIKADDKRLEALVSLYYGLFNSRINNSDVALDYYLKTMRSSVEAKDSVIYAKSLESIANLYLTSGYFDKAKEFLDKSVTVNQKIKDFENLAMVYHRMSLYHLKRGELDSAGYYLNLVLRASKESNNTLLYVFNLNNMASYHISNGNLDSGEQYSLQALHLIDSISPLVIPTSANSVINANLGLISQRRGDNLKALIFFNQAYADSLYNIDMNYRLDLLFQLYQTHNLLGNHKLANTFIKKYLTLRDSADKVIAKQNLQDIEMRYNFKQIQIENEQKQYKTRILFYAVVVTLGLGFMVLVLFIQKQRIKIKNVRLHRDLQELKLDKLNRELASQALNIARINERSINLIKTLKDRLPKFTNDNQIIVSDIIEDFEKDKNELAWNEFEMRFTSVHGDFYKKLSRINSNLTLNEKRLCAFLLLDMTTKEISAITGQSIRAIELARIRLRKQFNLTNSSMTLTSFLSNL